MCLAIPAKILELSSGGSATVSLEGVKKEISLALVADAKVGDYVLVHVGYALNTISPEEAEETLRVMADMSLIRAEMATTVPVS